MSDAIFLPPRPSLEQYKKLAKDLQDACRSGPEAVRDWAGRWMESLARLRGSAAAGRDSEQLIRQWRKLQEANEGAAGCKLAGAQFFVARAHGFESWPKFAEHVEAMARANSPASQFETAVDAIVGGDADTLRRLLREDPEVLLARSDREHRSTLLHYVSANGVEDFRQKTPKNIVEIAEILLDGGADVNAESEAYGGRSTTLGLTATSYHPQAAGMQLPLMELLIERGATLDRPDGGSAVNDCLHNGRGPAAEYLANRGARLDLEGASGVGRLEAVQAFFGEDGRLLAGATAKQMVDGFAWACEFGRTGVVDFLSQRSVEVGAKLRHHGQTGLHWAAYGGHADTVRLLLDRGAAVDARDESFGGTALEWALYQWGQAREGIDGYYQVVAMLVGAGARLDAAWFEVDDDERGRAVARLRSDPRMQAVLKILLRFSPTAGN